MQPKYATVEDVEKLGSVLAYIIGFLARHRDTFSEEEQRMLADLYKKFQKDMTQLRLR